MAAAVPLGEGSLPLDGQSVGRMRPSAADDGMDVLRSRLSHDGVNLPHPTPRPHTPISTYSRTAAAVSVRLTMFTDAVLLRQYVLLRGFLPRAAVEAGRRRIAAVLQQQGWVEAADTLSIPEQLEWDSPHPPQMLGEVDTQELLHEPSLARVLEAPELDEFFEELFAERACCFDFKWLR